MHNRFSRDVETGNCEASCKPERRRGLPHIMSDAREVKITISHYDSSTAAEHVCNMVSNPSIGCACNRGLLCEAHRSVTKEVAVDA